MIYKNAASQKIGCFAYTPADGLAKTGDAAQITAYISKDFGAGAAVTDTNPTELDATNMPGWYVFDLTQAETNAEVLVLAPKSSTNGVVLDQIQVFTQDASISSRASQASLDTVDGIVDDILVDTGTTLDTLIKDVPTANENADALLTRDWTSVTGEAARSVLNALRFLRNKWSVSGSTLTVTEEDDATTAWTAAVTGSEGATPISAVDPN